MTTPPTLSDKLRKALAQLPYLPRAFALVWAAARGWTIIWLVLLLVQGILPVASVYLTRALVDGLVAVLGKGADWTSLLPVMAPAALLVVVLLLTQVMGSLARWVRTAQSERVQDYISELIHAQSTSLDMSFFETTDYFDRLFRAQSEARYRPITLLDNLGSVLQNGLTLVAMAAVLVPYGIWIPVALLFSTLPALLVVLRSSLRQHRWRMQITPAERHINYYDYILTGRETAAEVRLFGLGDHFRSLYRAQRKIVREGQVELARRESVAQLLAATAALVVTGLALAYMLWRAAQGQVTLGELALFYQAFSQGQSLFRGLLENVGQVYTNSLFLGNLFEFLSLESRVPEPASPAPVPLALAQGLVFRNVTFHYPGSTRPALADFDLEIPAGKITALVGPNGAGKSTCIKLLCRFYDPVRGEVLLDGQELHRYPLSDLRRLITVLFQEPVYYNATVAENIAMGDLAGAADRARIEEAARGAGADVPVARLPRGYDTLLGKWFGGAELSVGEWQRLALARAFLRRAAIIVLDEPTSAMDSWAETDWLRRFRALAAGRTAVIITHRFTTAMQADIIHVMDEGRVVESGSHRELLAQGGLYARSWQAQMQAHLSLAPVPAPVPSPAAH